MKHFTLRLAAALAVGLAPLPAPAASPDQLRIIPIDVEGGAATLFVTPQGHSLLIDTGFPAGLGGGKPGPAAGGVAPPPTSTSAQRIVAAAKAAGLSRIDHVLISHYHLDHIGGLRELVGAFPVGAFIDHGPNREMLPEAAPERARTYAPETKYRDYLAAIGNRPRRVMKPGDTLKMDDMLITAVNSDGQIPARPIFGKGAPGAGCARPNPPGVPDIGGEENPRSLGIVASWGKARILSLGDTTWEMENKLVCPRNLIGPVDMMMANNHGSANSGNPNLLNTVKPTVFVFNNGPTKGADEATLANVAAAPFVKGMWQLHFATRSPASNAPADQIANLDGPDSIYPLQIVASKDGTIAVTNPRTGATITYRQSPRH
ncbi:MBL fold metallo-hydrolase [Sphingomonas sp.]|uniref:ComEC/Rec2 family competence protein n=1 Tax=Sphingomonas sp. TaxID=28214 RepID=UPI0025DF52FE|nr:MBL fold metallo-hydrolase [Sphingomonas sp.]